MLWIDRTSTNLRYAVPLADAVSRSLKMKLIMHIRNWTGLVRKKSYFPICQGADEKCLYTLDEYFKDLNNEIYYLPCYNNLKYIKDLSEKKGEKRCLKKEETIEITFYARERAREKTEDMISIVSSFFRHLFSPFFSERSLIYLRLL